MKRGQQSNGKGDEKYGTTVKEFAPIRDTQISKIFAKVVDKKGERFVDVRKYEIYRSTGTLGPTKAGLFLSVEEFEALVAQAPEITKVLAGSGRGTGGRR